MARILLATTVKWPSAARLAGALAALGCSVEAVFPAGHPIAASRYLTRGHAYRPLRGLSSLAAAIRSSEPDRIVACDDRALVLLLSLAEADAEARRRLTRSFGPLDAYPVMMARARAVATAHDEHVEAPQTIALQDECDLPRAIEAVGLPAVLKAEGSWGGDGVAVVRTHDEALQAYWRLAGPPSRLRSLARSVLRRDPHFLLDATHPRKADVIVQAFIDGRPATSAVACRDGEVLAALHMDVVSWRGAAGPATVMRRTDCPQMAEAARRLVRRFRLSGLQGFDFMRDEAGRAHLIEINPRATQICHLALGPGHDLPAALLDLPARPPVTSKPVIALFPRAAGDGQAGAYYDFPGDDPGLVEAVRADASAPLWPPHPAVVRGAVS
ncbi:MAG: ATP-grasp domain-containing protein [Alphaproteobacteria bacterium]|nr:ATP-grasp domain-containing protein [Alphaproteobacteria bacterium]